MGDVDALGALYGRRPVLMPQGKSAVFGKVAIRKLYHAVLADVRITSTGKLREVVTAGDRGFFWTSYSLRAASKAGGQITESRGKSVFIFTRQRDGLWKIARLIDNSDE